MKEKIAYLIGSVNNGKIILDEDTAVLYARSTNQAINELKLVDYKVEVYQGTCIFYNIHTHEYKFQKYEFNNVDRLSKSYFDASCGKYDLRIFICVDIKVVRKNIQKVLDFLLTLNIEKINCFLYCRQGQDYTTSLCKEYSEEYLNKLSQLVIE